MANPFSSVSAHSDTSPVPQFDFEGLWNYSGEWFETPNFRRQGWSGVCRILTQGLGQTGECHAFLKRQHNFMRRTWRHPWRGVPTFHCEYSNLRYLVKRNVSVPKPLFYAEQKQKGASKSILLTAELSGYQAMHEMLQTLQTGAEKRALLSSVAQTIASLHAARMQHRALYPKHILVQQQAEMQFHSVIIDLEKARFKLLPWRRTLHDLALLNRGLLNKLSNTQRLYFLKQYYGVDKLSLRMKWVCRQIEARSQRKLLQRQAAA